MRILIFTILSLTISAVAAKALTHEEFLKLATEAREKKVLRMPGLGLPFKPNLSENDWREIFIYSGSSERDWRLAAMEILYAASLDGIDSKIIKDNVSLVKPWIHSSDSAQVGSSVIFMRMNQGEESLYRYLDDNPPSFEWNFRIDGENPECKPETVTTIKNYYEFKLCFRSHQEQVVTEFLESMNIWFTISLNCRNEYSKMIYSVLVNASPEVLYPHQDKILPLLEGEVDPIIRNLQYLNLFRPFSDYDYENPSVVFREIDEDWLNAGESVLKSSSPEIRFEGIGILSEGAEFESIINLLLSALREETELNNMMKILDALKNVQQETVQQEIREFLSQIKDPEKAKRLKVFWDNVRK